MRAPIIPLRIEGSHHKHLFRAEHNLNAADDSFSNDRVSSLVVREGHSRCFRHSNFVRPILPFSLRASTHGWSPQASAMTISPRLDLSDPSPTTAAGACSGGSEAGLEWESLCASGL